MGFTSMLPLLFHHILRSQTQVLSRSLVESERNLSLAKKVAILRSLGGLMDVLRHTKGEKKSNEHKSFALSVVFGS